MEDYYSLLQIPRQATQRDIKDAFRKQALLHHPDMHAQSTKAERQRAASRFRDITEAYQTLNDGSIRSNLTDSSDWSLFVVRKRAIYDRYGRTAAAAASTASRTSSSDGAANTRHSGWYDETIDEWERYQRARGRYQYRMRWKDYSTRFGRFLAIQTMASALIIMFFMSVGSGTDLAWERHNRGKRFEDVMNAKFHERGRPDQ